MLLLAIPCPTWTWSGSLFCCCLSVLLKFQCSLGNQPIFILIARLGACWLLNQHCSKQHCARQQYNRFFFGPVRNRQHHLHKSDSLAFHGQLICHLPTKNFRGLAHSMYRVSKYTLDGTQHLQPACRYAKRAKTSRLEWNAFTKEYFLQRESLAMVLLLIDASIPPQAIDVECALWLAESEVSLFSEPRQSCTRLCTGGAMKQEGR